MNLENYRLFELSEEREKSLWEEGVFVFDTSALLQLYYFSAHTQQEIFDNIFSKLKGRLWIPGHVEYEYLKNYKQTSQKPFQEKYDKIQKEFLSTITKNIKSNNDQVIEIQNHTKEKDIHPYFTDELNQKLESLCNSFEKDFKELLKSFDEEIKKRKSEIASVLDKDHILEAIKAYFVVGKQFSFDEMLQLTKKADARYRSTIPPGYMDWEGKNKKSGLQRYGDFFVWKQIINYANEVKRPVILITNDVKDDWCYQTKRGSEKRISSPREELIKEIYDEASVEFWMYTMAQFMYFFKRYVNKGISDKLITEAELNQPNQYEEVIVDQEMVRVTNFECIINQELDYVAQTYVAGITGWLAGVSLEVAELPHLEEAKKGKYRLQVSIYSTRNGLPDELLGSSLLLTSSTSIGDMVRFQQDIDQVGGTQYAIIVSYHDPASTAKDQPIGLWRGETTKSPLGPALGRRMMGKKTGGVWIPIGNGTFKFRTFVIPKSLGPIRFSRLSNGFIKFGGQQ